MLKTAQAFSAQEFNKQIKAGKKLVLLNELVINVDEFMSYHPGGRFVLKTNIGRDISKFFYGGYCLEGNQGSQPSEGHNHSNYARKIIEDLIVGVYEPSTNPGYVLCRVNRQRTHAQNQTTNTFFLENKAKTVADNFRNYYKGFKMIGKHFKIRSAFNRDVHRHYTICNTMQPVMYNELLECLTSNNASDFKRELLDGKAQNYASFTIKNYKQMFGVSFRFFEIPEGQGDFELMGPLGKGLQPKMHGTHIAFAGGTGALTFMDLVGAIARHNLGLEQPTDRKSLSDSQVEDEDVLGHDFKFILYVSFPARSESVGLELCEALHKWCEEQKMHNFELVVRLSKEKVNAERWSQDWIEKTLESYKD